MKPQTKYCVTALVMIVFALLALASGESGSSNRSETSTDTRNLSSLPSMLVNDWWDDASDGWSYKIANSTIRTGNIIYDIQDWSNDSGVYYIVTKDPSGDSYTFVFKNVSDHRMEVSRENGDVDFASGPFSPHHTPREFLTDNDVHVSKERTEQAVTDALEYANYEDVSMPGNLIGDWYDENGGWNYAITNSTIRTNNIIFPITSIQRNLEYYKIDTDYSNRTYTFFFKIYNSTQMAASYSEGPSSSPRSGFSEHHK